MDNISQLLCASKDLWSLLNSADSNEQDFQTFFEEHSVVFRLLGYNKAQSFTKKSDLQLPKDRFTNLQPEPDFLVQRFDGVWEVFEIKKPFYKSIIIDRNPYRERFTAELYDYISQTTTYAEYFSNPENRQAFDNAFQSKISCPLDIKIVIGRKDSFDQNDVHKKCRGFSHKIDIISYDHIFERIQSELARHQDLSNPLVAFSIQCLIRLNQGDNQEDKYLFHIGNDHLKDAIHLFIRDGKLLAHLYDSSGYSNELIACENVDNLYGKWFYLTFDYAISATQIFLSVSINGDRADIRRRSAADQIKVDIKKAIIGANFNQTKFGSFDISSLTFCTQIPSFDDQLNLLRFAQLLSDNFTKSDQYISYSGNHFMHLMADGSFDQELLEHRPIFRKLQ